MKKLLLSIFTLFVFLGVYYFVLRKNPYAECAQKTAEMVRAVPEDAVVFISAYSSESLLRLYAEDKSLNQAAEIFVNSPNIQRVYEKFVLAVSASSEGASDAILPPGIKEICADYKNSLLSFGIVAYMEKPDAGKINAPDFKPKFAAGILLDTSKIEPFLAALAEKNKDKEYGIKAGSLSSGTEVLKIYSVKNKDSNAVFLLEKDRIMAADSEETLLKFLAAVQNPAPKCILDNPDFKKVAAFAVSPVISFYANLDGMGVMENLDTAPANIKAMNEVLKFGSLESVSIFIDDYKDLRKAVGKMLISFKEENEICKLFEQSKIKSRDVLKKSPKGSLAALSIGVAPFASSSFKAVFDLVCEQKGIPAAEVKNNPVYKALEDNLQQLDASVNTDGLDFEARAFIPQYDVIASCKNADAILSLPELQSLLTMLYSKSEIEGGVFYAPQNPQMKAPFILNAGNKSIAISSKSSANDLQALAVGKAKNVLADSEVFKYLHKQIGDNNAIELYFDYVPYMQLALKIMKNAPDAKQVAEFYELFIKSIKDYAIAYGIEGRKDLIKFNFAGYVDFDYVKLAEAVRNYDTSDIEESIDAFKQDVQKQKTAPAVPPQN